MKGFYFISYLFLSSPLVSAERALIITSSLSDWKIVYKFEMLIKPRTFVFELWNIKKMQQPIYENI
jgi:hypothetical protein